MGVGTLVRAFPCGHRWRWRLAGLGDTLQRYTPDVVALQEPQSADDVAELLAFLPPTYASVVANGTVGDDGAPVAYADSALLYDTARFALADRGWYWLSPTPDVPSMGWSRPSFPRLVVWARLAERDGGSEAVVVSTHFDGSGANRGPSATLFMERTGAWVAQGLPVVAAGDFNSELDSEPYRTLVEGNGDGFRLNNTLDLATAGPRFVHNSDLPDGYACSNGLVDVFPTCLIDHIFVAAPPDTGAFWTVQDWAVDLYQYRPGEPYFASDHRAHFAALTLADPSAAGPKRLELGTARSE